MIKPIQNSVSFTGMQDFMAQTASKVSTEAPKAQVGENIAMNNQSAEEKPSFKRGILGVIKNYNRARGTAMGVAKGLVDGVIGAGLVGYVGRNIRKSKESNYNIGKVIGGLVSDAFDGAKYFVTKTIPHIITKSPLENARNLLNTPREFYNKCLKGSKGLTVLTALVFVGALAFRTIQGKMIANKRNAEVDHYTGYNH